MNKIRFSVLILSLGFIAYGIYIKEYYSVFQKAVNICLECIGIG